MTLRVVIVPVTPFQQNCSLAICDATGKAARIDPGDDVTFEPGPGPRSTCGAARRDNPLVGDRVLGRL